MPGTSHPLGAEQSLAGKLGSSGSPESSTGMRHAACSARRHTCACTRLPPRQLLQLSRADFHGASRTLSKGWGEWLGSSRYPAQCRGLWNPHMPGLGCSNTGGGHSLGTCIKARPELFLLGGLRRLFQRQTIVPKQVSKLIVSKLGCWVFFPLHNVPVCHQWRCLVLLGCKMILGILPCCRNTLAGHSTASMLVLVLSGLGWTSLCPRLCFEPTLPTPVPDQCQEQWHVHQLDFSDRVCRPAVTSLNDALG